MHVVCAWCAGEAAASDGEVVAERSHGLCAPCLEDRLAALREGARDPVQPSSPQPPGREAA